MGWLRSVCDKMGTHPVLKAKGPVLGADNIDAWYEQRGRSGNPMKPFVFNEIAGNIRRRMFRFNANHGKATAWLAGDIEWDSMFHELAERRRNLGGIQGLSNDIVLWGLPVIRTFAESGLRLMRELQYAWIVETEEETQ